MCIADNNLLYYSSGIVVEYKLQEYFEKREICCLVKHCRTRLHRAPDGGFGFCVKIGSTG